MREKLIQLGIRFPESLVKQIDEFRDHLENEKHWINATRTDATRALVHLGLEAWERSEKRRKGKGE